MTLTIKQINIRTKEEDIISIRHYMTMEECINTIKELDKKMLKNYHTFEYIIKD